MPGVKKLLVIISLVFYIIACCTYAYNRTSDGGLLGITCLAFGWFSFTSSFAAFVAWLANFPYFINVGMVFVSKRNMFRLLSSVLAVLSMFLSFGAFGIKEVLRDENGTMETVTSGPGLFLWVISMFIMVIAAVLPTEKKRTEINYINNPNPIK